MIDVKAKIKQSIFYILMFMLTVTLCFVMLELVFARLYYSNLTEISSKLFDHSLGWRLKPGTYWIKPPHTFRKHPIYINDLGLRNRDISLSRKDTRRILLLGDSFTHAEAIPIDNIFSTLLEKTLHRVTDTKYEVINCGVPGYGTAQELLFMQRLAEDGLTGNIYILLFFTNDILDNLRLSYGSLETNIFQPGFVLDSNGTLELKYLPSNEKPQYTENFVAVNKKTRSIKIIETLKLRIESFLQTKPNFIQILNSLGFDAKMPRMPGLLNAWYREDVLDAGIPLTKQLINQVKYKSEELGAELFVCIIPSPIQIYWRTYGQILERTFPSNPQIQRFLQDVARPQSIITKICQDLKIPCLDLYPVFYENNNMELFIPREGHFNKNGHALVAQSLAKFIAQY